MLFGTTNILCFHISTSRILCAVAKYGCFCSSLISRSPGIIIIIIIKIIHHHHHVHEGLGAFPVPSSSRSSWSLHLFHGRRMFPRPFGLYYSTCFVILFVSILCTCCSLFIVISSNPRPFLLVTLLLN